MPIRMNFGNWTNFIKEAGYEPRIPEISIQARLNTIKAHKGHRSTAWKGGRIKDKFGYEVDCPKAIPSGIIDRFEKWHEIHKIK